MVPQSNLLQMFLSMFQINSKKLITLISCFLALFSYAGEPVQTTITCKLYNNNGSAVALYKIEAGQAVSLGFRRPGEQDTCQFSFTMEKEGIYFLQKPGGKGGAYTHVLYLKPGEQKLVDIYFSNVNIDFDSCYVQSPNKETMALQTWADLLNGIVKLGMNKYKREEFISAYDTLVNEVKQLKKNSRTGSQYFNYVFASKVDADILYLKAAAFFNFGSRLNAGYDSTESNQQFYQSMAGQKFCNASILHSEHGLELIRFSIGYNLLKKYGSEKQMLAASFVEKAKSVCNDSIRRAYVISWMPTINTYEQFKIDIQPFKNIFTTTASKEVYQKKADELTVFAKGAPAYNFKLKDTKDRTVSMSDFKGKVVVMDIWAMWCAPCLTEKPFFQKVEESFKDRDDIVFIGVSHDGLSRRAVWKNFVAKKGWKNIELLANYNESIGKYYKVDGIPRLMIFDKEGKIVTVDAPRPSDPAFKELIEQILNLN
jgi:peroxiredoxin